MPRPSHIASPIATRPSPCPSCIVRCPSSHLPSCPSSAAPCPFKLHVVSSTASCLPPTVVHRPLSAAPHLLHIASPAAPRPSPITSSTAPRPLHAASPIVRLASPISPLCQAHRRHPLQRLVRCHIVSSAATSSCLPPCHLVCHHVVSSAAPIPHHIFRVSSRCRPFHTCI